MDPNKAGTVTSLRLATRSCRPLGTPCTHLITVMVRSSRCPTPSGRVAVNTKTPLQQMTCAPSHGKSIPAITPQSLSLLAASLHAANACRGLQETVYSCFRRAEPHAYAYFTPGSRPRRSKTLTRSWLNARILPITQQSPIHWLVDGRHSNAACCHATQ